MVVLAIDTSHPVGGVALGRGNRVLGFLRFTAAESHLVQIGRCVDRLLRGHELEIDQVGRIALVEGPGSFTGLRVGLSYTKGLYAALGTEVVTLVTLKLLALPLLEDFPCVCSMIDARRGEVYAAVYRAQNAETVVEPRAQAPADFLAEAHRYSPLFVGSGALRYRKMLAGHFGEESIANEELALPSVEYLCRIAPSLRPLSDNDISWLEPCYIRASDAELKRLKPIDPHV